MNKQNIIGILAGFLFSLFAQSEEVKSPTNLTNANREVESKTITQQDSNLTDIVSDSLNTKTTLGKTNPKSSDSTSQHSPKRNDISNTNTSFPLFTSFENNAGILGIKNEYSHTNIILPFLNINVGYSSNKLALTPYKAFWKSKTSDEYVDLIRAILHKSFRTKGQSASEVSETIEKRLGKKLTINTHFNNILLNYQKNGVHFDITLKYNEEIQLPKDICLIAFSGALKENAKLNIDKLSQKSELYTDIKVGYGIDFNNTKITDFFNNITGNIFNLSKVAVGGNFHLLLGHNCILLDTKKGNINISENGNYFALDANSDIKISGLGIDGQWGISKPQKYINGGGTGLDLGMMLYGKQSRISFSFENIGFIKWKNAKRVNYKIKRDSLTFLSLIDSAGQEDFWQSNNSYLSLVTNESDTFTSIQHFFTSLPTKFTIGLSYNFDSFKKRSKNLKLLSDYYNCYFQYSQGISKATNNSFIPEFTFKVENGFLKGILPICIGHSFGGMEGYKSTLDLGVNLKAIALRISYMAPGNLFWYPRRGIKLKFDFITFR